jgi:hypothetical protein
MSNSLEYSRAVLISLDEHAAEIIRHLARAAFDAT